MSEKQQNCSSIQTNERAIYYLSPQMPVEEDEINLIDYWRILMRYKWLIILLTVISAVISVVVAFNMTPIYQAEVTLAPVSEEKSSGLAALAGQFGGLASLAGVNLGGGGGKTNETIATLNSRVFIDKFIKDKNLMPVLFSDVWNTRTNTWKVKKKKDEPTYFQADQMFSKSIMTLKNDSKTGLYTLAIDWKDPKLATQWANELVKRINFHQKQAAIDEAKKSIAYLKNQLNETSVVEMRQAIFRLIEAQTKNIMLANVRDEFAFKVIDPAVVPENPIKPKKKLIAVLGTIVGFMLGVFLAFFIAFVKKQKEIAD